MAALVSRIKNVPARNLYRCLSSKANNEPAQAVKGMKDRFGDENRRFQWITEKGVRLANLYGFEQITTPILEYSKVFERTLGEDSDVVGKELYKFVDKGEDQLTMRPEGTAGITRALISQRLHHSLPQKYYYYGPMFRRERQQKGRLRQFEQFGVELYGQSHASSDVEVIELASAFLRSLGLKNVTLEINSLGDNDSRTKYREALRDYLFNHKEGLSEDSVNRLSKNPLRILDSKAPQDIKILGNCPILSDYLSASSQQRFSFITETLSHLDIPFTVNPKLVRGLDYYQETVFEFKVSSPELGPQQGTVLAGGRYDGLVEKMGGIAGVPSIGWAAGLERLSLLLKDEDIPSKPRPVVVIPVPGPKDYPADKSHPSPSELHSHAMGICTALRQEGIRVEFLHLTGTKYQTPRQLARANELNASHAILIGSDEMSKGVVTLKTKSEQRQCRVDELIEELQSLRF
ncbi:histidyl-tRNA synthetase [Dissophora ornata]|nr:hypothetical protein BGZ58_008968 [Dissophora ornata]KAI8599507.1 histidyl-tRNA synthetase [Dissophora ornata]